MSRPAPMLGAITRWTNRDVTVPIRSFLRTESGSSGVLVAAIVAALIWDNISPAGYERVWHTRLAVDLGSWRVDDPLRVWINSGLMTLFFLVAGLEARREFDLGDLRDRRRLVLPMAAGLVGLAVPALLYLAVNPHGPAAHGWGVAMSTDTALALGLLSTLGSMVPDRVRVFLLTVFVVDDIGSLLVIGLAYSSAIHPMPLILALLGFALLLLAVRLGADRPALYALLGLAIWLALRSSGIDPVVTGLVIGLTATAYVPARDSLEQASTLFRQFREQPTAEIAREASLGVTSAVSPNSRLQRFYHGWTSYLIVPLFGLANAGVSVKPEFLRHAITAPVFLGVLLGYVVGKPIAVAGTSWLIARLTHNRIQPAIGWASVAGSGTIAGVGFTVSFLIATLAFQGRQLDEAKLGVLAGALVAALLTAVVFRITALLPEDRRARALQGQAEQLLDLAEPVDENCDHIRGPAEATVTIVEYGDFECPYCGQAETAIRTELASDVDVRFVWRHLPLLDVHPHAQLAAEASEAAAAQGKFWQMHDLLLAQQDNLTVVDLMRYAEQIGLDTERFHTELKKHLYAGRVANDVDTADLSAVTGTPTFFINGRRHYGAYDADALASAVLTARDRAVALAAPAHRRRSRRAPS